MVFAVLGFGTPLLLWGALAVASPIIIHLLSKRRFKIIHWAAMEFLLDAAKRNRKRIRMENLILLLLRCMAIAFVALLVAMPFFNFDSDSADFGTANIERIIVLDDSPSMGAAPEIGATVFDKAKDRIGKFVDALATAHPKDSLTLIVASDYQTPLLKSVRLEGEGLQKIRKSVDSLEISDKSPNLHEVLQHVRSAHFSAGSDSSSAIDNSASDNSASDNGASGNSASGGVPVENVSNDSDTNEDGASSSAANKRIYLITDLRSEDWAEPDNSEQTNQTIEAVRKIAEDVRGGFQIVDVGEGNLANISIKSIEMKDGLGSRSRVAAGVNIVFQVVVFNAGITRADNVGVELTVAGMYKQERTLRDSIGPGREAVLEFPVKLKLDNLSASEPLKIHARFTQSTIQRANDALLSDNQRLYAARLVPGEEVLIVDGDSKPGASTPMKPYPTSERKFLNKALQPQPDLADSEKSGFIVQWKDTQDFESMTDFDRYKLIYLCNVARLENPAQIAALKRWVNNGGGLVITLGDRVLPNNYNKMLYEDGYGLLPAELIKKTGDTERKQLIDIKSSGATQDSSVKWVSFKEIIPEHPLFLPFESLPSVVKIQVAKVFRWWELKLPEPEMFETESPGQNGTGEAPPDTAAGSDATKQMDNNQAQAPVLLAQFSDINKSPAIVERSFGRGRVLLVATSIDLDWNSWASEDGSFVSYMLTIAEYMVAETLAETNLTVGEPIKPDPLNREEYGQEVEVVIEPALGKDKPGDAASDDDESGISAKVVLDADIEAYVVSFEDTNKSGFYELKLKPSEDVQDPNRPDRLLYAVNLSPSEGNLQRVSKKSISDRLGETKVTFTDDDQMMVDLESDWITHDLWKYVLYALLVVLAVEMFLAWRFGTRR